MSDDQPEVVDGRWEFPILLADSHRSATAERPRTPQKRFFCANDVRARGTGRTKPGERSGTARREPGGSRSDRPARPYRSAYTTTDCFHIGVVGGDNLPRLLPRWNHPRGGRWRP